MDCEDREGGAQVITHVIVDQESDRSRRVLRQVRRSNAAAVADCLNAPPPPPTAKTGTATASPLQERELRRGGRVGTATMTSADGGNGSGGGVQEGGGVGQILQLASTLDVVDHLTHSRRPAFL